MEALMKKVILIAMAVSLSLNAATLCAGTGPADAPAWPIHNGGAPLVADYGAEVPLAYYQLSLLFPKRTAGFTPPVQSRAYAYMGLALYEAVVTGMPHHRSIAPQLNGIGDLPRARGMAYHWPLVASASLAEVMRGLWGGATNAAAANIADIDALEARFESDYTDVPERVRKRSIDFGRSVGAAVFETSKDDGGHEGYNSNSPASYVPPEGPDMWVPTTPGTRAIQPYWGTRVTPFALLSPAECDPGAPLAYSEQPGSTFYADAYETYLAVKNVTADQLVIAKFWAAIPGPGHSAAIANQILVQDGGNLET